MTHAHTLKLVPADLDRVYAALRRAGVPVTPFQHPFQLVAAIEAAVTVTRARDARVLEDDARACA